MAILIVLIWLASPMFHGQKIINYYLFMRICTVLSIICFKCVGITTGPRHQLRVSPTALSVNFITIIIIIVIIIINYYYLLL